MPDDLIAANLRASLLADPRGLWPIARDAQISYPNLKRFAQGRDCLSLRSASRLMLTLGIRLANTPEPHPIQVVPAPPGTSMIRQPKQSGPLTTLRRG